MSKKRTTKKAAPKKTESKETPKREPRPHSYEREVVNVRPVVCPKCSSPNRAPFRQALNTIDYKNMQIHEELGVEYNRVEFRRTQCLDCKQHLIVKCWTMRPSE